MTGTIGQDKAGLAAKQETTVLDSAEKRLGGPANGDPSTHTLPNTPKIGVGNHPLVVLCGDSMTSEGRGLGKTPRLLNPNGRQRCNI